VRFMNDYDIARAMQRYDGEDTPNRYRAALAVAILRSWADANSDGWCYWPKPCRAAARLFALLEGEYGDPRGAGTNAMLDYLQRVDATDAEFKAALRPVKAFLTRHGANADVILRGVL